ncbi:MAG: hypothetical protein WCA49_05005 [Candidatus Sulfotelmatobacter sp.]
MKRLVAAAALLLLCISFPLPSLAVRHKVPRYLTKESTVDMSKMNHIFLGWVDLGPDEWAFHGYDTKTEWTDIIDSLNAVFSRSLQVTYLPGRTITAAKDKGDENAAGNDLYIKFSDVRVDYDNYHLILSMHFIDPRTNAEIASIPTRPYYGNDWGLKNYLKAALDEVGTKLEVEVTGELQGKKKR